METFIPINAVVHAGALNEISHWNVKAEQFHEWLTHGEYLLFKSGN
jgi:hypothetical protein